MKVSETKTLQRRREVYFTFKSVLIFQIFESFYILVLVINTIMLDKISKKNIAENSTDVSLKTLWFAEPIKLPRTTTVYWVWWKYNERMFFQFPRKIYNKTG